MLTDVTGAKLESNVVKLVVTEKVEEIAQPDASQQPAADVEEVVQPAEAVGGDSLSSEPIADADMGPSSGIATDAPADDSQVSGSADVTADSESGDTSNESSVVPADPVVLQDGGLVQGGDQTALEESADVQAIESEPDTSGNDDVIELAA